MPDIVVKGKGKVSLAKTDFVAAGGEGQVFQKGGTAYKLYTDPAKMMPRVEGGGAGTPLTEAEKRLWLVN